jgi:hypothetical protein
VARKELPLPVLKIAALVGYYQPMHKKDLVEMVGPKGWEHVLALEKLGLLIVKRSGHGYAITTSPKYAEYFGLAAKTREDIKRILAKKAGIAVAEKPRSEAVPATVEEAPAEGCATAGEGQTVSQPQGESQAEAAPEKASDEGK